MQITTWKSPMYQSLRSNSQVPIYIESWVVWLDDINWFQSIREKFSDRLLDSRLAQPCPAGQPIDPSTADGPFDVCSGAEKTSCSNLGLFFLRWWGVNQPVEGQGDSSEVLTHGSSFIKFLHFWFLLASLVFIVQLRQHQLLIWKLRLIKDRGLCSSQKWSLGIQTRWPQIRPRGHEIQTWHILTWWKKNARRLRVWRIEYPGSMRFLLANLFAIWD